MNRHLRRTFTVLAVGLVTSQLGPACTDDNQSVFVNGLLAPPLTRQQGACVYTPDPTQLTISSGTLDVAVKQNYNANLLVGSMLIRRSQRDDLRAEPNRVYLQGAIVRVTDAGGRELNSFTALSNATIDPSDGTTPAYSTLLGLRIVDETSVGKVASSIPDGGSITLIAYVKVFGNTAGEVSIESAEYQVPVRLCRKCLVTYQFAPKAENGDDAGVTGDLPNTPVNEGCNLPPKTDQGATGAAAPCDPGQDEMMPCNYCRPGDDKCKTP